MVVAMRQFMERRDAALEGIDERIRQLNARIEVIQAGPLQELRQINELTRLQDAVADLRLRRMALLDNLDTQEMLETAHKEVQLANGLIVQTQTRQVAVITGGVVGSISGAAYSVYNSLSSRLTAVWTLGGGVVGGVAGYALSLIGEKFLKTSDLS